MSMFSICEDGDFKVDLVKLEKALKAWAKWYSAKLDRIGAQIERGKRVEDYSGAEQDLFEALGCQSHDEKDSH
jgi:hypothetical protein